VLVRLAGQCTWGAVLGGIRLGLRAPQERPDAGPACTAGTAGRTVKCHCGGGLELSAIGGDRPPAAHVPGVPCSSLDGASVSYCGSCGCGPCPPPPSLAVLAFHGLPSSAALAHPLAQAVFRGAQLGAGPCGVSL
jgi:hypothetical protein